LNRNATGEYIEIPSLGLLEADDQTIALWAKRGPTATVYFVATTDGTIGGLSFSHASGGVFNCEVGVVASANVTAGKYADGVWSFIAIVWDASAATITFWDDGVILSVEAKPAGTWTTTTVTRIFENAPASFSADVTYDDLRIYSRALTEIELNALAQLGTFHLLHHAPTGGTFYAYPSNKDLAEWNAHKIQLSELGAPNAGRYQGTIGYLGSWHLFDTATIPANWNEAIGTFHVTSHDLNQNVHSETHDIRTSGRAGSALNL